MPRPEFMILYNGTEVVSMLFEELTEEEARELSREDGVFIGSSIAYNTQKIKTVGGMPTHS